MDTVLQNAPALDDPEAFIERLKQPVLIPDVHTTHSTDGLFDVEDDEDDTPDLITTDPRPEAQH